MAAEGNRLEGVGNKAAYLFAAEGVEYGGLRVAAFRLADRLGAPFELELLADRRASDGPLDLATLLDQPATLGITTAMRWRPVHGVVIAAEEIDRTKEIFLYRFVVAAPAWRMSQRVRYRTFVDRTLREVLTALLENRSMAAPSGAGGLAMTTPLSSPSPTWAPSAFEPANAVYRWAVSETERLDDRKLRSYVVQYGESDLDLFHRLLEEEGLTYFTEHGEDAVCLTIVDHPGAVSPFGREERVKLVSDVAGMQAHAEHITSLRRGHRLDWGSTTAKDWDPARPTAPQRSLALDEKPTGEDLDPALFVHDTFPSRDGHVDRPCTVPATLAVERRAAERSRMTGRSTIRFLAPSLKIHIEDDRGLFEDTAVVVTEVTSFANDLVPEGTILDREPSGPLERRVQARRNERFFENELVALPEDVRYRPPLTARPPRLHGVQTAVVSAEEVVGEPPEIHRNEAGEVRLRFPWDERLEPGRPSSIWVRVSQGWAGAGYGHVFTPRVGQEVLVAYEHGDPERPLIVGRVYDAIQPIPYTKPTQSTIKTKSSPKSDGYNELRFDDEAGNEEVYLQAERNLNELVKASHSTSVGGDQSNGVGGNQSNAVAGNRTHTVKGNEDDDINGNRTVHVGVNETRKIDSFLKTVVGASEDRSISEFRNTKVGAGDSLHVGGWRSVEVVTGHKRVVSGPDHVQVADRDVRVAGVHNMDASVHKMIAGASNLLTGPHFKAEAWGTFIELTPGSAVITNGAASISLVGGSVVIKADTIVLEGGGGTVAVHGAIDLNGKGEITATAGVIKLNG